jgi:hypothetical protein
MASSFLFIIFLRYYISHLAFLAFLWFSFFCFGIFFFLFLLLFQFICFQIFSKCLFGTANSFVRTTRSITFGVRVSTHTRKFTIGHNLVLVTYFFTIKIIFKNFTNSCSVSSLCRLLNVGAM